ncbi:MAG TPA: hypothetical protein VNM45_09165, partial [Bacillus sp. (in: firmicutes)]|nr:hypothetical protein [Bacillus sp. (in: firmicutes)]
AWSMDTYGQPTFHFSEEETMDTYEADIKNFKDARIIIKRLAKEKGVKVPAFIKDCRTFDEAVTNLFFNSKGVDNDTLKNYVNYSIKEFIDYLEEESIDVQIVHVECEAPK